MRIMFMVTLCAALLVHRTADAQEIPRLRVSGGLTSVIDYDVTLKGFVAEAEYKMTPHIGLVGEMQRTTGTGDGYFSTWAWNDLVTSGGVRLSFRPHPVLEPFAHVLVGAYRAAREETYLPRAPFKTPPDSFVETTPVVIFGGGLTIWPAPRVGIRMGVDVQKLTETLPMGRFTAGVVVGIGR